MSRMVSRIDRALYPRQSTNWDDCIFRDRCITGCRMSNVVYFGDNLAVLCESIATESIDLRLISTRH